MRRITEEANPATDRIDSLEADEILDKFRFCDEEMFGPAATVAGSEKKLFDRENLMQLERVKAQIRDFNATGSGRKSAIVLTGSGTSGRIAYFIAKKWNDVMECDVTYLIAGGDRSLVTSQEAPEDDFDRGAADLKKVSDNYEQILLIAISCAMTAPYVIGQLRLATSSSGITSGRFVTSCLVGFNTTDYFMNAMKGETSIVNSVSSGKLILINPIVGPEAITGSSRMKGGSMTKVLLETLFMSALFGAGESPHGEVEEILKTHQQAISNFYETCGTFLGRLMRSGGDSLIGGSEILYFGVGNPALLGVIDAAECIPTFGAGLEDVRGFILGGFDQKQMLGGIEMGEEEFWRRVKCRKNLTIFISMPATITGFWEKFGNLSAANSGSGNRVFWMPPQEPEIIPDYVSECCHLGSNNFQHSFPPQLVPYLGISLKEICYKLAFNSVSTGAFILNGKVYHNMMVDMKLSNEKLFHRAINIVQKFCEKSTKDEVKEVLLKIIYKTDNLSENIVTTSVHDHITVAESEEKVIPCAIIMLKAQCSRKEAVGHLKNFHKIRDAVDNI